MFVIRAPAASCASASAREASGAVAGSAGAMRVIAASWRTPAPAGRAVYAVGSRRCWWTKAIAMLPSPTAAATRLTGA